MSVAVALSEDDDRPLAGRERLERRQQLRLDQRDRARGWRRANQPGGQNAGSVFTNPPGDSAGRLIDAAGLKGLRIGTAEVSPKHANFIQADPDGSADDVYHLISKVRRRVVECFGIVLHCENLLIGFEPLDSLEGEETR